jgi:hypothetical protein
VSWLTYRRDDAARAVDRIVPPPAAPPMSGSLRSVNAAACDVLDMLDRWIDDGGQVDVRLLVPAADRLRTALGETTPGNRPIDGGPF